MKWAALTLMNSFGGFVEAEFRWGTGDEASHYMGVLDTTLLAIVTARSF